MNTTAYVNEPNSPLDADDDDGDTLEEVDLDACSNVVLSIMWKYGKLVASYYNMDQKMLYSIMETIDRQPKFPAAEALIRELSPKHIITLGKLDKAFVQALIGFVRAGEGAAPNVNDDGYYVTLPSRMTLLDFKEFTFNASLYRVRNLHLQSQPSETQQSDRLHYIQTLINIDSTKTIHVLGALVKFLEQTWNSMRTGDDALVFLHLRQLSLTDHVYIDNTTFTALNVFNQMKHDSTFKHGASSSCREGASLFKLLSQHCVSKLGLLKLRELLVSPIKNIDELTKRYDFMDFIIDPRNAPIVTAITIGLRKITNVSKILNRIKHSQGNKGHWRALYNTIYTVLQINGIVKPLLGACALFRDYHAGISEHLYNLEACMERTLDLKGGLARDRPAVKEHTDEELDAARGRYRAIKSRLVAAAAMIVNHLPPHLETCSVAYVPDMGHVLSVRRWSPNCHPDDLLQYGCYYLFDVHDMLYYKNALCQELDTQLGDLPSVIQDHENRIIQRVAEYVINENAHLMCALDTLTYMEALISMAKVGKERNYVRPKFNALNMLEIKDGRHPLVELNDGNYVSNHYASGGLHKPMKVITGPNASGKSMYLKQTALLVYMAHVGSYLPAAAANISLVHSIHSRLQATESAALNMSAFTIDLFQMGHALYNARQSSLVVMDEFGRGTTGNVSKALLLGALRHFLAENLCPHVIISTHMTLEQEFLDSPLVHYQKMTHMRTEETDSLTFLYKIADGESSSFTFEMAEVLDPSILERARQIYTLLDAAQPEFTPVEEKRFFASVKLPVFDD